MGFSVSGSAAIVFAALFIAFGMWHSATADSFERVSDAREDRADDALEEQNAAIDVVTARHTSGILIVEVTNNGTTSLSLNGTDIIVDGEYKTGWQGDAQLDGQQLATDLWLPGETLNATFSYGTTPDHVTVATENGVSDGAEVTV